MRLLRGHLLEKGVYLKHLVVTFIDDICLILPYPHLSPLLQMDYN